MRSKKALQKVNELGQKHRKKKLKLDLRSKLCEVVNFLQTNYPELVVVSQKKTKSNPNPYPITISCLKKSIATIQAADLLNHLPSRITTSTLNYNSAVEWFVDNFDYFH